MSMLYVKREMHSGTHSWEFLCTCLFEGDVLLPSDDDSNNLLSELEHLSPDARLLYLHTYEDGSAEGQLLFFDDVEVEGGYVRFIQLTTRRLPSPWIALGTVDSES